MLLFQPKVVQSWDEIKCFCTTSERYLVGWVSGFRFAKVSLRENHHHIRILFIFFVYFNSMEIVSFVFLFAVYKWAY